MKNILIADDEKDIIKLLRLYLEAEGMNIYEAYDGLGLAISKRIAEKHGGRLYVNNNISGYVKGFVIELEIIN